MQVDKKHYGLNFFLASVIFLAFFHQPSFNLKIFAEVIVNTTLIISLYRPCEKIKFYLLFCYLFEILSTGIIGLSQLKYFAVKLIMFPAHINLKLHTALGASIVVTIATCLCMVIELMIKHSFSFVLHPFNSQIVTILTVIIAVLVVLSPLNKNLQSHNE